MSSVLLRYASPLMSFGHSGRFDNRPTAATPTVSAIQGMVAAAAGIGRGETWPDWLADLHLAMRVDHRGTVINDYHTVNQPPLRRYAGLSEKDLSKVRVLADAEGKNKPGATVVSRRGYVADATFLVAIHDPAGTVSSLLAAPVWHLYAGRKSCPLTAPFLLGRHEGSPEAAVATVPTVPHPTESQLRIGDLVERDTVVFTDPGGTPSEARHDRASGFRRHRPCRRWHTTVTVSTVASWFDVHDHLDPRGASA